MSNGSERTPERCVHAVDGPDWAGLRELYPEPIDYELTVNIARARYKLAADEMDRLTAGNPGTNWRWSIPANPDRDSDLILSASVEDVPRLADAVESLLAIEQRLTDHIVQLAAERDSLQGRLDAMGVEWHTTRSVNGTGSRTQVRSVTSWTVVPEGDDHE